MKVIRPCSCALLGAVLALVLVGCTTSKPGAKLVASSSGEISELDLVTLPVAVNLESQPGIDGFAVRVYAGDNKHPKTQPVRSGVIEVLMFEGLYHESFDDTTRCRHLWSYPNSELPAYAVETTVGTGYFFTLGWGADRPRSDRVTLVARYRPTAGRVIYSAPSYLAIPAPASKK